MSARFDYLTIADALAIHAVLLRKHGGSDGVRDMGALESALFRPQTGYYSDLIAEAAALLESLAMNHPFIDGNKRVAFAVTDTFLRINGWRIESSSQDIYARFMEFFGTRTFTYKSLEPWLREVAQPISPPN
ncbi:MAG: type II toxin-antitoxin system death-on-curing family toxin [Actinobacteria bacterium]|nr:type II toxin-antitoxin system death-on-curing family toxin [Actinomycetota bacterium]